MENTFNGMEVSLESNAFCDFKQCFQNVVTDTIQKMLKNEESEGTVTAKIKISLCNQVNDLGVPYKEPLFSHEVTGAVQQKQTLKGALGGDYSLEFDVQRNAFVLRPADVAQTKMDDYL